MKFSEKEIENGAFAVRWLSEKAREYYSMTSPIFVAEYYDADGKVLYAYGESEGTASRSGLTIEQLDADFSELYDIVTAAEEE